jgi:transcription antitermination factor NusG
MKQINQKEEDSKLYWYPFYTKSRFEKKADESLKKAGFEVFLPLMKKERNWSDRKKIVEMPLFSSYIFVRIPKYRIYDVLQIYGIVRYIVFNGRPATVRDSEIELIRKVLSSKTDIEVVDGILEKGAEVTIKSGIFKGYSGKYLESKGKNKIVIEIESINKTLLVTVEMNSINTNDDIPEKK